MSARFLLRRDRVVQAGAGTGKTHALLTQYLHLCAGLTARHEPLEPRALCALTFTDKAAGEMRERLQRRTSAIAIAIAQAPSENERATALLQLAKPETDLVETAAELGRPLPGLTLWDKVLAQLPGAPIGTFHSFAASLLRRYAEVAGLDPDFTLLDQDSARALLVEAGERVVLGALEGRRAAEAAEEAALVVSEYGFSGGPSAEGGVVEALCRLYQLRAEEGKDAAGLADSYSEPALTAELLAIRAAFRDGLQALSQLGAELGQNSAELLPQLGEHGDRLLARLHQLTEPELAAALLPSEELVSGLKKLRAKKDAKAAQEELTLARERLKTAATELRALHQSLRAVPLAIALEHLLDPLATAYSDAKQAASALDFTDLLRKARDLLRDHKEVRTETQARFAVLLVDEFQDTNPLQAELLELLAGPFANGGDDPALTPHEPGRLYIVGDRKQSIYEFRGADVAAYTSLCDRLIAAGAEQETLSRSYRSQPQVLHFVSALFAAVMRASEPTAPAAKAPFFVHWDDERDPLQAVRPPETAPGQAAVELVHAAVPANPEAAPAPTPIEPIELEAELLAQRIIALRSEGEPLGHMVVLLRRYTHLGRYTLALKRAGIPHYVIRGRGFFQAQEVLDITALLTLLCDLDDRLALLTLLRSPLCGLSDDSLLRLHLDGRLTLPTLLQSAAGTPPSPPDRPHFSSSPDNDADEEDCPPLELLGDARVADSLEAVAAADLSLPTDEAARLRRLLRLLKTLLRLGDRIGPAACLQAVYDTTDLLAVLAADPDGEQRIANLLRLQDRARGFDSRGGLRAFVRALRVATDPQLKAVLASPGDEPEAQIAGEADDVVRIMTVHQAKGLEFPIVFVAGCTSRERTDSPAVSYDRAVGLGLTIYEDGERVRTLPARRVDQSGRLRASAESARLFYVAATRARDRLIFLGETGPRPRLAGTWRAHLDALLLHPDTDPPLLAQWHPGPPLPPTPAPILGSSDALLQAARQAVAVVYAEEGESLRTRPRPLPILPTAAAADLLVCARRFHLRTTAQLFPPGTPARPALTEEAAGEPVHTQLRRGSLAGQLLARIDPIRGSEDLESQFLIAGVDLEEPAARELRAHLLRFLAAHNRSGSTLGALLRPSPDPAPQSTPRVQRAISYVVQTPSNTVTLRGVLDVVHTTGQAHERVVTVIDYQYCLAPEYETPLHTNRRALLSLVAAALYPNATQLRTGLCFLREADAEPILHETKPETLTATDAALAAVAPYTQLTTQAALKLPVLPPLTCAELACEYQPLCHPRTN